MTTTLNPPRHGKVQPCVDVEESLNKKSFSHAAFDDKVTKQKIGVKFKVLKPSWFVVDARVYVIDVNYSLAMRTIRFFLFLLAFWSANSRP